jgi:hypothetical protein
MAEQLNVIEQQFFETLYGTFPKGSPQYDQIVTAMRTERKQREDFKRKQRQTKVRSTSQQSPDGQPFFETLYGTFYKDDPEYGEIVAAIRVEKRLREEFKKKQRQSKPQKRRSRKTLTVSAK